MKKLIILTAILAIFFSCKLQKENAADKVGPMEYILKEELTIGDKGGEECILVRIKDISVDSEGNIYILETKIKEVKIFNKKGEFIRAVARKGQGPGELLLPTDLLVDDKSKMIYITDRKGRKISKYHLNGEFDSDIKTNFYYPDSLSINPNGYYLVLCKSEKRDKEGIHRFYRIIKMTRESKVLEQSRELPQFKMEVINRDDFTFSFNQPYASKGLIHLKNYGQYFYYAFSDKYEINVFDTDFNKIRIIRKPDAEKISVTKQDEKKFMEDHLNKGKRKKRLDLYKKIAAYFKFPKYYPILYALWEDDEGRLLVKTFSKDDKAHIDVFNSKGVFLKKMIVHKPKEDIFIESIFKEMTIFKNGCIYTTVYEADNLLVRKYRLVEK